MLSLLNTTFTNAVRGGVSLVSKILSKLTSRADVIESEDCVKEALRGSAARNASLVLIPSAYSDGKVHAVLPDDGSGDLDFARVNPDGGTRINSQGLVEEVSLLGDELVTNGTFETILGNELITNGGFDDELNGWLLTQATIINGVANISTTDGSFTAIRQNVFTIGKTYLISLEVSNLIGTAEVNTNSGTSIGLDITTNGTKSFYMKAENTFIEIKRKFGSTNVFATIDNISVKEVIEGYIDDTELVANGGFDDGSGWSLTSCTIGNEKVTLNSVGGANAYFTQTLNLTTDKTYQISFDAERISGDTNLAFVSGAGNNVVGSPIISTTDSYSVIFTPSVNLTSFGFKRNFGGSGAVWEIDNISVKEVVQDSWVLGTGWSIEDGKASSDGSQSVSYLRQNNLVNLTSTYVISFSVSENDLNSGSLNLIKGNAGIPINVTNSGEYTFTSKWDGSSADLAIQSLNFTGSIDNVSVKEVIEEGIPRLNYDDIEYQDVLGAELVSNGDFEYGEIGSTNLLPYSEDFSQWNSINNVVVTNNFALSPSGLQDASKLVFDGTTSGRVEKQVSASGNNTMSVYLKAESGTHTVSIGSGTIDLSQFQITDQWARYTHNGGGTFPRILCDDAATIYVYGAQLEALPYATSYIPTNGGTQTRVNTTGWTLGDGAKIFNEKLSVDGTQSGFQGVNQLSNIIVGRTYKVTFEVSDYVSGSLKPRLGSTQGTFVSSNGIFSENLIASVNTTLYACYYNSSFIGSIDNISVKEVLGQEVASSGCPSLLLEPQSTNLIQYSEDFSQSSWTESNSTVTSNYGTSPRGIQDSTRLQLISSLFSRVDTICVATAPANKQHTVSCWVKSNGNDTEFRLKCTNRGVLDYYSTNLVATNEWQRFTFTQLFGPIAGNEIIGGVVNGTSNNSADLSIYGFQLEQARPYATSYIPTSGGIATRSAETLEKTNISHLINSEEGVLYVEMKALANDGTFRVISIGDGTNNNKIQVYYTSIQNQIKLQSYVGGNLIVNKEVIIDNVTHLKNIAIKWSLNDYSLWVNGVELATSVGIVPIANTYNKLSFNDTFSNNFYGSIKDVRIYKSIADAQKDLTYIN
jgi:hypothetical protein